MQVKSIADWTAPKEQSAILSICINLPTVIKTFILSVFELLLKTGLTVIRSCGGCKFLYHTDLG